MSHHPKDCTLFAYRPCRGFSLMDLPCGKPFAFCCCCFFLFFLLEGLYKRLQVHTHTVTHTNQLWGLVTPRKDTQQRTKLGFFSLCWVCCTHIGQQQQKRKEKGRKKRVFLSKGLYTQNTVFRSPFHSLMVKLIFGSAMLSAKAAMYVYF